MELEPGVAVVAAAVDTVTVVCDDGNGAGSICAVFARGSFPIAMIDHGA